MNISNAALAFAAVALLAACGSPTTRTGGDTDTVTLTAAQDTDLFNQVAAAPGSSVSVAVDTTRRPDDVAEDDAVLAALAGDDIDLGLIRSGRLLKEGASSLAPLSAPFLVTNNDQALAIAHDPVANDLMADLGQQGLVGVGLVPVGAFYPFGYREALLGAADYEGQRINVRVDAGWDAILGALGAVADNSVDEARSQLVRDGSLRGIPVWINNFGAVDTPAVLTGNVTLYERFDVLVVRQGAWDSLTGEQQDELKAMVATARDAYADTATDNIQAALADWCHVDGASATLASQEALASLHTALDPVAETMTADHADTTAVLRSLGEGTSAPALTCPEKPEPEPEPDAKPAFQATGDQTVLDGTWRFEVSEQELLAAGALASDAHGNAGVWEMTLNEGAGPGGIVGEGTCTWTFQFAGDTLTWDLGSGTDCDAPLFTGTYEISGDTVDFYWDHSKDDPYRWIPTVLFAKAVRVQG